MGKYLTTENFIKKANIIHNSFYNYNFVEYNGTYEKVKIICPKHGEFLQAPYQHLHGAGCKKCAYNTVSKKLKERKVLNTEIFIQKSKEKHGDYYDYSLSIYTKGNNVIKVICPEHGVFETRATRHMNGANCRKCCDLKFTNTHLKNFINTNLYFLKLTSNDETFYKVGIAVDINKRICEFKKLYNVEVLFFYSLKIDEALKYEELILKQFNKLKYIPKKIFAGVTECLSENPLNYYYYLNNNVC